MDAFPHTPSRSAAVWLFDQSNKSFILKAKDSLSRNDPIRCFDGKLSNRDLLLDYGYTVPENPYDQVQLTVKWDERDPNLEAKKQLFPDLKSSMSFDVFASLEELKMCEFFSYVRVIVYEEETKLLEKIKLEAPKDFQVT